MNRRKRNPHAAGGLQRLQAAAQSALAREDWDAAHDALDALIAGAPGNASLHFNRGLVRRRLGRLPEAIVDYEAALKIAPDHANARFEHAAALLDLGHLDAAESGFRRYLEAVPDDGDAILNLARLQLRLGRAEAARDLLDSQAPHTPDFDLIRAEAARDCGDADAAMSLLSETAAGSPEAAAARLKIATQGPAGRIPIRQDQLFAPRR